MQAEPETPAQPDSRAQIVAAAARAFMRKGLDKATIDDIADELGATKGRVYHHFRSKNAICFAVHAQAMEYCFEAIEPILDQPLPADEKLLQMAAAHGRVMMDTLPFQRSIRLGVDIHLRGPTTEAEREMLGRLIERRNAYEALFRQVLREGQAEGTIAVPGVRIAGRAIMGALNGLVDWYRPRPDQTDADRARLAMMLARTVIDGLRA